MSRSSWTALAPWPCTPRSAIRIALLAVITVSAPVAAGAAGFDQFIGFGDSTKPE